MVMLTKVPHTVCVMVPCCDASAPWAQYEDGRCRHSVKRVPTFTVFNSAETARAVHRASTRGWWALPGWVASGVLGEGNEYKAEEVFYIQRIMGSLTTHYEYGRVNTNFPFPSVESALEYAEERRMTLYGVTDRDGVWVHCSYARPDEKPGMGLLGVAHEHRDWT